MHSIKNSAIAMILLGVSFGLYQMSSVENPEFSPEETPELLISDGASLADIADQTPLRAPNIADHVKNNSLPRFDEDQFGDKNQREEKKPAIPSLPSEPTNFDSPNFNASKNLPVDASTNNSIQSIQYPESTLSAESLGKSARSTGDFNPPTRSDEVEVAVEVADRDFQVSQRETLVETRDQGLIDALEGDNQNSKIDSQFATTGVPQRDFQPASQSDPQPTSQFDHAVEASPNLPAIETGSSIPIKDQFLQPASQNQPINQPLTFQNVWQRVDEAVETGDFRHALSMLTSFYHQPDLSGPQRQRLLGWLDALAAKVIFSLEDHLSSDPYSTTTGETVADIATRWNVPAQLIFNVNQANIPNPLQVPPGTKLKQLPGPFTAELDLASNTLTLFLGDLYAGRFDVRLGRAGLIKPGDYQVVLKSEQGFTWRDADGNDYPPEAPENGYGPYWIGLSDSLCIHAIEPTRTNGHHGCIGLLEQDAKDVFAILSEVSTLKIR